MKSLPLVPSRLNLSMALLLTGGVAIIASLFLVGVVCNSLLSHTELMGVLERIERESARKKHLIQREREILKNIEGKEVVLQKLLNQAMPLRAAAMEFQRLNRECPQYEWDAFYRTFPGRTDEERHCRQVLASLRLEVKRQSGRGLDVLTRLEAEFGNPIT